MLTGKEKGFVERPNGLHTICIAYNIQSRGGLSTQRSDVLFNRGQTRESSGMTVVVSGGRRDRSHPDEGKKQDPVAITTGSAM